MNNIEKMTLREFLTESEFGADLDLVTRDKVIDKLSEDNDDDIVPIYIRLLSGVGAWFASLFFMFFLGMTGVFSNGAGAIFCGVVFLIGAIALSRSKTAVFFDQLALVLAIAGNILIVVGVAIVGDYFGGGLILVHAVVCCALYPLFNNSVYRFLAPIALAVSTTLWVIETIPVALHAVIAVETIVLGWLMLKKRAKTLTPLFYSAATILPATLLFMNLTQINTWGVKLDESIWPSSLIVTAALIYFYNNLKGSQRSSSTPWFVLAVATTVVLGLFTTPGILVAIGLLVAGFAFDDRILMGLSYLLIPCFLVSFYYVLNIDLAYKSYIVAGSGVALLIARWLGCNIQKQEEL